MNRCLLVLTLILASGHSALATVPTRSPAAGATLAVRRERPYPSVDWTLLLANLRLEFFDSEDARTYTAAGPYQVISETADRVVVRGAAIEGNAPARVTIRQIGSDLWAFARFDSREFAVLIH